MNLFNNNSKQDISYYKVTCPKCGSTLQFTDYCIRNTAGFQSYPYLPCPNCENYIYLEDSPSNPDEDTSDTTKSPLSIHVLPILLSLLTIPTIYILKKRGKI